MYRLDSASRTWTWALAIAVVAAVGCGDDSGDDAADSGMDAGNGGGGQPVICPEPETVDAVLPDNLACTGLFADVAQKTLADGVRLFAPAHKLWSDGAEKTRWIWMPEGMKIDASNPDDWKFPPLTRLYKEFQWKGHRVETRVFWKVRDGFWLKAAYRWNEDETEATRFDGGEVEVAGDTYEIPTAKMCDQCHKGRTDRALGFEATMLGLPGAEGITLASLIDDGLLEGYDGPSELSIGDDGTGMGAEVLPWLHVNCGVSCHNDLPSSEAYKTDLRMRLRTSELDGSETSMLETLTTNVDRMATTRRWEDWKRITPGDPEQSLLYYLVTTRDDALEDDRMPPIGSRIVPEDAAALIKAWIEALPPPGDLDGGVPDEDAGL